MKELLHNLVRSIGPVNLNIYQQVWKFSDEEYDNAVAGWQDEEYMIAVLEKNWHKSLPTPDERRRIFGVSDKEANQMRMAALIEEYQDVCHKHYKLKDGDHTKRLGEIKKEYKYRMAYKPEDRLSDDEIRAAREKPLEYLIEVNRGNFALCPFHADRNPSMHVTDNLYNCFSCMAKGDTIKFVMETEKLTFPHAVRWILSK